MNVRSTDWSPPLLLKSAALSPAEWIGGFAAVSSIIVPTAIILALGGIGALISMEEEAPVEVIEEEVVSARFVQLGRDFQDELPNRVVPQAATAPPDSVALSDDPRENVEREERERPDEALERDLSNLLDRSDLFAEEAEAREREGSELGIEEGTETQAQDGDIYAGQLYAFFRRGWTVPTTITEEQRRDLSVEATIQVAENLQIISVRIRGTSGNPDFDQSVVAQIERLRANNIEVPEPPLAVRPRYVGAPFTLRFHGRNAR